MHSDVLVVAYPHRLPRVQGCGAVAARCTAPDTVHLVSAAATPLGGDIIAIRIVVEPGGRLRLRSAAASVALPGPKSPTSQTYWEIEIAGSLDIDLEPTVVAANARHVSSGTVALRDQAKLRFRERVQIGRYDEGEGFWSGSLHADRDGRPLLRHRAELGAGSLADDAISSPRAAINELRYPASSFEDSPIDAGATVLMLAGGGMFSTWQADRLIG